MAGKLAFRTRGDWRLEDPPQGPRVVIPTRPIWPIALFLGFWLCGWTAGEVSAVTSLFKAGPLFGKGFLIVWLTGWTLGGALAWVIFLATIGLAREAVWRDGPDLCVRWSVLGLGWTSRYAVAALGPLAFPRPMTRTGTSPSGAALVVADDEAPLRPQEASEVTGSPFKAGGESDGVRFSHGSKERAIGAGLDEGQAARLAEVLALRFGLRLGDRQ